jgi:type IV secretion system protein VirB10
MKPSNATAWFICSALLAGPYTLTATAQQALPTPPPQPQRVDVPVSPGIVAAEKERNGQIYIVPAGTKVLLSLKSGVNTKTARPGDGVYLISTFPVIVGSHVLIPSGVYVQGVVDKVERPGRIKGRAKLLMHFTTMIFPNGQVVGIPGAVDNLPGSGGPSVKGEEGTIEQPSNKGKDMGNVAKGGVIGASGGVIGGAASGRPLAGAAVGGLAGVAGGLIYTLLTRGDEVVIPEGTSLEMVMQRPLELQASQLDGINDVRGNPQYIPSGGQARPLSKPAHIVCPSGSLGCN